MERKVSPRSVIVSSVEEHPTSFKMDQQVQQAQSQRNGYDEEPFDCAVHLRRKSLIAENLSRGRQLKIPMQSPRKLVVPKSPSSVSSKQKASSYRLRRMQLAQQRKWKEEYIERTVQSKSIERDTDDERTIGTHSVKSRRDIGLGKEVFIDHAEGLEISISNQLQKSGFDSSLIPPADRYDCSSNKDGVGCYDDNDDRSIAMDTVSSLNSSHYASDIDGLSVKESKTMTSRRHHREKSCKKTKKHQDGNVDSLHPPLYVSSVKKIRRNEATTISDDEFNSCDEHDRTLSVNALDRTEVVSNKDNICSYSNTNEKENDIPWFKPKYKTIESRKEAMREVSRERPIQPQMLQKHENLKSPTNEPPSLSNAKSPTVLRRRRLQLYLQGDENNYEVDVSMKNDLNGKVKINLLKGSTYENDNTNMKVDETLPTQYTTCGDEIMSVKSSKSAITYATMRTCMTIEPSSPEEMDRILEHKKRIIFNIHHALICTYPHCTNPDDESYVPCPVVRHCQALDTLVKHVQTCTTTNCPVPGCKEYKKMWNHYRRCILRTFTVAQSKKCRICSHL